MRRPGFKYLNPANYPSHFVLTLGLLLALSCTPTQKTSTHQPLNIIVIMADDLGYETIGAYGGSSYQTPEIDRMAANGMRFDHCYAQPLCTPSRVKLMTGIYNVRNYVRFGLLDKSQTTFGNLFRKAGYATCIVGKWQLGKDPAGPQQAGFDQHCLWQVREGRIDSTGRDTRFSKPVLEVDGQLKTFSDTDYGPEIVSEYGLDFIEKSHHEGKPFLLYYPMILTHCPFSPTPNSPEWGVDDSAVMTYKGQAHYFEDMVAEMDGIVGKINRKLEVLGIQDNTLLVFTGDNGTDVPVVSVVDGKEVAGAKGQSTDAGTRVPLIIQWPNEIKANSSSVDLVDFSDFLPTLSEAANIKVPDSLAIDGRSFLPQLRGESGQPREWIYNWYSRSGDPSKASVFARTHRYKLYESGAFYEVPKDAKEQYPLEIEALDADAAAIYQMLNAVLVRYKKQRLNKISKQHLMQ
ncbi:MAG: sulfatase-like hydrolase/transferase [Maribacter sp.]|uniref:sulfatase-like hydrolase/transferase n=1 Tax=Maribacter sp. TaxID=1897614 RepID=UPI003298731E